jgi:transcriptional regulator with XRE-family HTH domain
LDPPGEFLRRERAAYGISQGELATRANTTQSAISRIEAGKVSPSFDTLRELLRLLGTDLRLEAVPREIDLDLAGDEPISSDRALEPGPMLDALDRKEVDFVVVGGVAGLAHGATLTGDDLEIAYARGRRNLERLAGALRDLGARPPGAPADKPYRVEGQALQTGMNFAYVTEFGPLAILGRVDGVRGYADLRAGSAVLEVAGRPVPVASLDHLIGMKRRVDRTRDQLMLEEYVAIDRRRRAADAP